MFFWLTERRLERLRNAPPYRQRPHEILTLDTEAVLDAHASRVELAHLNTGAVHPSANYPRGAGTFRLIPDDPWQARQRVAPAEPIVELTVPYALPNADDFVIDITTR